MTLRFPSFSLRIGFSFFAVLALMLLLRDRQTALVCFLSALFHECGHLLLLRLFGARVSAVSFCAAGVVIERRDSFLLSNFKEALAALGGVAANGVLCLLSLLFHACFSQKTLFSLLYANLLLGGLNLLPAYPLDLWRALHALFVGRMEEKRLERVLRAVSLGAVTAFCAFCVYYFCRIGRNVSLLAVCVYLMTLNLKRSTSDV